MRNPWAELPDRAPYVLKSDAATVSAFNRVAGSKTRLRTHILPEPFLGKPRTARVLLLQLNPGFAGSEVRWHQRPDFARVLRANLTHSACDCANPYLDPSPALARSPGGTWWRSRLRRVIEEVGDASRVARRLAVVEFHGYHSPNFRLLPVTLPSQRYGFWLVRRAIDRDARARHGSVGSPRSGSPARDGSRGGGSRRVLVVGRAGSWAGRSSGEQRADGASRSQSWVTRSA